MKFKYYEIRPCVEVDGASMSFLGKAVHHTGIGGEVHTPENAMTEAMAYMAYLDKHGGEVFWTLYGRDEEGLACAIGDFETFAAALDVLNAILEPMAEARDKLRDTDEGYWSDVYRVADDLDDVINQSTNEERL